MKSFYYFILLLSLIVFSFTSCADNDIRNNGYLCKYLLLDLGLPGGDYLIEVTDSGVMTISSGLLSDDFYNKVFREYEKMTEPLYDCKCFKEVCTTETRRLTPAEFERLKKCVSKIENVKLVNPFAISNYNDIYSHMIIINDNKLAFVNIPSEDFSEFLKTLLELTHREWTDRYGRKLRLDYDERWVYEGHRKKSCWERIKDWF